MKTFYTLTDIDTNYTNSRSTRYDSEAAAERAARERLEANPHHRGVVILKAIKTVRFRQVQPVVVADITE